ncbi:TnpV protein [Pseudoflavonifractor sp. An187]|nr:TnpV protein [Pseudoflavonifractor sp. An187]
MGRCVFRCAEGCELLLENITLLTSGRLNAYLADIDRQAQERMERLTEQMERAQGITEQLKAENALEWVQRMNNIRACAREIVEREIIFSLR